MRQHRVRSGRVDVVVLSGGGRDIPAVDDDLGQGDDTLNVDVLVESDLYEVVKSVYNQG